VKKDGFSGIIYRILNVTGVDYMEKSLGALMLSFVLTVQSMGAGYSIVSHKNPEKFMETVRKYRKKYCKVLGEKVTEDFEVYIYRLKFQIIAQVGGHGHVATITGLKSEEENIVKKIEEAKQEIKRCEEKYNYVGEGTEGKRSFI